MNSAPTTLDILLFAVLPYVVLINFFLVTISRYRNRPFTYSSLSSQFLENQQQFWGAVAFHYGVLGVLVGHLLGFLIPSQVLLWNAKPLRLYVAEITGMMLAMLMLVGLFGAIERRLTISKARIVTSKADWVVLALLVVQAASGIYVALFYPWGTSWFATSAAPYLWSIVKLQPDVAFLLTMPFAVKLHILNAYLVIAAFPFTRLVHALVAPVPYLWRKPEVVRWYGNRTAAGDSK